MCMCQKNRATKYDIKLIELKGKMDKPITIVSDVNDHLNN